MRSILRSCYLCLSWTIALAAMLGAAFAQTNTMKVVPVQPTTTLNGSDLYRQYCAVCHGVDSRGDGPAAEALQARPSDLTQLTQRNNGKFPALRVQTILKVETDITAHGNQEMPIWGELLKSVTTNRSAVTLKIEALTEYLRHIQR
jgi:mono/diheme cytochrome c family protein